MDASFIGTVYNTVMCDVEARAPVKVAVDLRPVLFADALRHAVLNAGAHVVLDGSADVRVVSEDMDDVGVADLAVVIVPSDGGGPIIVCHADGTAFRLAGLLAFESWLQRART